jgi:hypothetical protein
MNTKRKLMATVAGGLAIAAVVAATTLALPQLSSAQAQTPTAGNPPASDNRARPPDRVGPNGGVVGNDKFLADALGITQAELQTARTKAHEAAIQQAVKDGLITQAQADAMLNKTGGQRGVRIDLRSANIDQESLLANALGISVEKLQAAEETAFQAELGQAVTNGRMTQAQADQIKSERALAKYIADKGLFTSAVQSAVSDGVITPAQADSILSSAKPGMFGGFGFDGFEGGAGMRGSPGHSGPPPQAPQS